MDTHSVILGEVRQRRNSVGHHLYAESEKK